MKKLTSEFGTPLWVWPGTIQAVTLADKSTKNEPRTKIYLSGGCAVICKESVEEVRKMA